MSMTAAVLVAADGEPEVPPGQPYVSPDDLASIAPLWQQAVAQTLIPIVAEVWQTSAGRVYAGMVDATQVPTLPSVGSLAAEQYLAQATNTFTQVGDDLWATARSELLDGFEKGESIPQLAARLRASAGMTAKTATLVARTQVLDASNAGSIATARATGVDMLKEWMSAEDLRVRPEHVAANGQQVDLNAKFTVGGYECDRPHDPTLPPGLRYNCRCTTGYVIPEAAIDQAVDDAVPPPPVPGTSGIEPPADPYAGDLVNPALPGPDVGGVPLPVVPPVGVRPVLEAARTTSAVSRVFGEEYQRITGRTIPRGTAIDFQGSAATAREHAEGLLQGLERFPDADLRRVAPTSIKAGSVEYASQSGQTIAFNYHWTTPAARKTYLDALQRDVDSRWHPTGTGNPTAVALHEFGHILDTRDMYPDLDALLLRKAAERDARLAATRAAGEMVDVDDWAAGSGVDGLIVREVSRYATRNRTELVAEAFSDVMVNGAGASDLSRDIFGLLEASYRRGGGTIRAVEVAPALPSPAAVLAGRTVAQLRAIAKERGIRLPTGAKKADIIRILDEQGVDLTSTPTATRVLDVTGVRGGPAALAATRDVQTLVQMAQLRRIPGVRVVGRDAVRLKNAVYDRDTGYAGGGYRDVNRGLQQAGSGPVPAEIRDRVADLDQVISLGSLSDDVVLYRGLARPELLTGGRALRVGDEFTEHGYGSTSVLSTHAEDFARGRSTPLDELTGPPTNPTVMRMVAPKGQPAVQISDLTFPGVGEVLLPRGMSYRVVADRGVVDGVRHVDVEIIPTPAVPAEVPLAKRTVAQLRALAADRNITLPPGARKPDIVRLLEAPPLTEAEQRAAARAAARATNQLIENAGAQARVLAEVDELLAKKASPAVIREALDDALTAPGQLYAGVDPAVLAALRAVASDPVKLRAAVTRLGGKAKIKPVSKAGAKTVYDPATMEGVGGVDIPDGARVIVVRRGSTVTMPDGTVVQLEKARVTPVTAPVKKAAPAKAAPVKKTPAARKAPAGPDSVRVEGQDLTGEVTPMSPWLRAASAQRDFGDPTDKLLTAAVRQQPGWSDPGTVVTKAELDRAIGSGWVEMWRGVSDQGWGKASKIAEATRTGSWDMGHGVYGNGVYTSVRRTTAEIYRQSDLAATRPGFPDTWGPPPLYEWIPGFDPIPEGKGGLIRMALDPRARIIDYEDLKMEHRDWLKTLPPSSVLPKEYREAVYDPNFYAILRGYDGVRVSGPGTNDGAEYPPGVANVDEPPQYIIFNRTVLMFERASRRYDT